MKQGLILFFFVLQMGAQAIGFFSANESLTVFTLSGINLRDKPNGAVLAHIPYGAMVETLEAKNPLVTASFEGIPGSWTSVKFENKIGYVFDGFLSHLAAPSLDEYSLEQYTKAHFTPATESILLNLQDDGDGNSTSSMQVYKSKFGDVGVHTSSYYEGGSESISIPSLSLEEGYLLVRILFRNEYKTAKESNEIFTENFDRRAYDMLILNGSNYVYSAEGEGHEIFDFYFVDLSLGCYSRVSVSVRQNRLLIESSGGC